MLTQTKPDPNKVPGFWDINDQSNFILKGDNCKPYLRTENNNILILDDVLDNNSVNHLKNLFLNCGIEAPVSVSGLKDIESGIGSVRATGWSEIFAKQLSDIIIPFMNNINANDFTSTDWHQDGFHRNWEPVAVSPMLRFMRYEKNKKSRHNCHYDAGFIYPNSNYRTLKSVVIYLTSNDIGGATRFINDGQDNIKVFNRNFDDWLIDTPNDKVYLKVQPVAGNALIFDHRLCHDVEENLSDSDRIIIRTDIIYKAII